jgi:hypothetical protein
VPVLPRSPTSPRVCAVWSSLLDCQAGDSSELTCRLLAATDSSTYTPWWQQPAASPQAPQSAAWALLLPQTQAGDWAVMSCQPVSDNTPWWQQQSASGASSPPQAVQQSAVWSVLLPQSQAGDWAAMSCQPVSDNPPWWQQQPSAGASTDLAPTCGSAIQVSEAAGDNNSNSTA